MDIQGRLQLMLSRNWGVPIILPALQPCNKAYGIQSTNKMAFKSEYSSNDVIKMKFLKLWDLSGYSDRTMSKRPTWQK